MMDRDLMRKLQDERGLTPDEWLRLDEALDSVDARTTQSVLRSLPHEEPSLAWRSELNVRLAQTSKAQRQKRTFLRWLPVMAAPVAAGCALMVMFSTNSRPNGSVTSPVVQVSGQESIEARMIDIHRDALAPVAVGANVPYESTGSADLPISKF